MKYGLIGEHLGHSFSKQIQTRIAEIENVKDYDYQLVELNKEEFKEFMEKKDFKMDVRVFPGKSQEIVGEQ